MKDKLLDVFECRHDAHEDTTLSDCKKCPDFSPKGDDRVRLLLVNKLCPGDVLVMTAALESLHAAHPDRFVTGVKTSCDAVFENNPYVTDEKAGLKELEMEYSLIHHSNQRAVHFMQGYCDFLAEKLGVPVPLSVNKPKLYLSNRERTWINQVQEVTGDKTPYWVVNAGHKRDYTTKWWGHSNYQRLVDILKGKVRFVQVGAKEHPHKSLEGVVNLIGKTDHRQLIRLVYHSAGGVGPSTFLQHLCAAWDKPYALLLGGREPLSWVQYPRQQTLHTMGFMDCCKGGGCWKSRVVPLLDGSEKDQSLCKIPVSEGGEDVPGCLARITPEEVASVILKYQR